MDTVFVTRVDTLFERDLRPEPMASWSEVYASVKPSVYWVGITYEPTASVPNPPVAFVATAFAVMPWVVATNAHVAFGAIDLMDTLRSQGLVPVPVVVQAEARSFLGDGTYRLRKSGDGTKLAGKVHPLYSDFYSPDVAFLYIEAESEDDMMPTSLDLLPTFYAKGLVVGDEVATSGFPGAFETNFERFTQRVATSRSGNIDALRPYDASTLVDRITNKVVQTSFDNTGGTSGSPIFNIRGEVVAVHFGDAGSGDGSLDVAIRIDELQEMLEAYAFDQGWVANTKPVIGRSGAVGE